MTESEATGPGDTGEASRAADDFRIALERRRETEDLLAKGRVARQEALDEATEILRVAEEAARVIEEAARAAARTTLAEATARAEQGIAQQRHAQAAYQEQVDAMIARIDAMASDVQLVLDRAMAELIETLTPLAEPPVSWTVEPHSTNGDGERATAARRERWRTLFRPPA